MRIAQAMRHKKALSALEKKGGGGAAAAAAAPDAAPAAAGTAEKTRLGKYGRSSEDSDLALSESGEEYEDDDADENVDRGVSAAIAEAIKVGVNLLFC